MIATRNPMFWQLPSQLLVAIKSNDVKKCTELLEAGADCDQVFNINRLTRPALCIGVEGGFIQLVELFIRNGSSVNRRDENGRTPLHIAAEMGYLSIGEMLVGHRADVNAVDNKGISPLHIACKGGKLDFVQCLLTNGADVNRKDETGKSPLLHACSAPKINHHIVQTLISFGAEADMMDSAGFTPLLYTLRSACYSYTVVETLVSLNARLDILAPNGKAPLHLVVESNKNNADKLRVLRLILEKSKDVNLQTHSRQSPVHLACIINDVESLKLLMLTGADPNTMDLLGAKPLHYAASSGSKELIQVLARGGMKAEETELKNLNLEWAKPLLIGPTTLKESSRRVISKIMGGKIIRWMENNRQDVPATLVPFFLLETNT